MIRASQCGYLFCWGSFNGIIMTLKGITMADHVIIEVHSITAAAPGWRIKSGRGAGCRVVCFALVTTTSSAVPGSLMERSVIPLIETDLNVDLLGREVVAMEPDIAFDDD